MDEDKKILKEFKKFLKQVYGRIFCLFGKHKEEMHPSDWIVCKYCMKTLE